MSDKRYIHIEVLSRDHIASYKDAAVQVQELVSEEDAAMPSSKMQGLLRIAESIEMLDSANEATPDVA